MDLHYLTQNIFGQYLTRADDGVSGTSFDRPDFQRMISDIEAGKINMVVTKDAYVKLRIKFMQVYFGQENSTAS